MENEQWSADYQQSVTAGIERPTSNLNNGNIKILAAENDLQNSLIKQDPDSKTIFPAEIKCENGQTSVLSEKSKQAIQLILAQIKTLSPNEKYLFYLKLPSEITDIIDPFRQPLNPLGSRSEISRTIVWIQTHLEEDQNISLPKKEVYNEYEQYCDKNTIKPLSQADFGKVMKQVFPKVRARRLGQRGNSKYCYSGLRRRVNLKPPLLPDISDKPLSTEAPITQSNLTYAAWLIVKDWAQQQLGVHFTSLQSLANYLVRHCSIGSGSEAASKLTSNSESQGKGDEAVCKNNNKHREMQIQLQKKIQQRNEGKERKRKIPPAVKSEPKPGVKKCRSQSVPASSVASALSQDSISSVGANGGLTGSGAGAGGLTSGGECSTASSSCGSNSVSPTQGRATICDKPEFTQLTALPDFNSFQKPVLGEAAACNGTGVGQEKTNPLVSGILGKKLPIPRLHGGGNNGTTTSASHTAQAKTPPQQQRKPKYKVIQPRLQPCDIATYNSSAAAQTTVTTQTETVASLADTRSQQVHCGAKEDDSSKAKPIDNKYEDNLNECDDDEDFPLTRERLESVSNVDKDAMDEYLGTNNSQHEEELSKYFNGNEESDPTPRNREQLSTLRQLLEQNGISEKKNPVSSTPPVIDSNLALPADSLASYTSTAPALNRQLSAHSSPYVSPLQALPTLPSIPTNTRRRVSFETPDESVPPSPNTRSKNFNFTPISPGPHSPNSSAQSKCSSTNASPFVSPRNTPVPRTKNTAHQNAGIMLAHETRKGPVKGKKDVDLTPLEISNDITMKNYIPMSAPVSPMLQKLLNTNSKIQYRPEYANVPKLPQQQPPPDPTQLFTDISRSQSVPLHQMQTAGVYPPISDTSDNIISEILTRDPEFCDIPGQDNENVKLFLNSLTEAPPSCDNNNIDAFNLDISSNTHCLTEFGLNIINTTAEPNFTTTTFAAQKMRNITRSQSIDVESTFELGKCNPSRSVPSTPLPFTQSLKVDVPDNKAFQSSSRSYPSTPLTNGEPFVYQVNTDCLLNGQPIRTDNAVESIKFIQSYEIAADPIVQEKGFQLDGDFGIIETGEALMDESSILIQQGYNGNIN